MPLMTFNIEIGDREIEGNIDDRQSGKPLFLSKLSLSKLKFVLIRLEMSDTIFIVLLSYLTRRSSMSIYFLL